MVRPAPHVVANHCEFTDMQQKPKASLHKWSHLLFVLQNLQIPECVPVRTANTHVSIMLKNYARQAKAAGETCCFKQSDAESLMELFIIKQKPKWNIRGMKHRDTEKESQ